MTPSTHPLGGGAVLDLSLRDSDAGLLADDLENYDIPYIFCSGSERHPVIGAHPDAPVLSVLAAFLRNGFLHRSIREQGGAYGGGASHDPNIAAFRFFSYRDPRLVETLTDFDAAITWLLATQHEQLALEEAILSVMASLDKPGSPAGEAKRDFHERLFGRTAEHRKQLRAAIVPPLAGLSANPLESAHDDGSAESNKKRATGCEQ